MQEDKKIRVILADDHQIVLDGLSFVLRDVPDIEVVGMVNDGEKVLEILRLNRDGVDVAVLDISMPVLNGIETTHKIHRMYPQVKVLILTMYGSEGFISQMAQLGVAGYMLKESGGEELQKAIRAVSRGEKYYDKAVVNTLLESISQNQGKAIPKLTKREIDVLRLIGQGLSTPEISGQLHIAPSTVDTHRRNLIDKLGVNNTKGLIKYAVENGYT